MRGEIRATACVCFRLQKVSGGIRWQASFGATRSRACARSWTGCSTTRSFAPATAGGWRLEEGTLPVDISEVDGKLGVRASLPGFNKEDIDVQVHEGILSIKAEHSEETETGDERFYRRERRFGSLSRRIALPGVVHDSKVDAELKDGVLTLTLALPEKPKPKQIEIRGS